MNDYEKWNDDMAKKHNPNAFITQSGVFIRWVEALRLTVGVSALKSDPVLEVLDVGCGPGNLTMLLPGKRVVAMDFSDTMLAEARERLAGRPGVEVVKGDAELLPFPDSSFDRVICSEMLEHVRRPDRVISEIHRVCRPGGRVVITVPNESLIAFTKRIVLALGIKKWIQGNYKMPDDMLEEWHSSEITVPVIKALTKDKFRLLKSRGVPIGIIPYHRVFVFAIEKHSGR